MIGHRMTCDPRRIEQFLEQQLNDEERTAFEAHLDDCGDCRRRLEAAAAGDDIWSEIRDSLRGQQLPADGPPPSDSALDSAPCGDASFSHATVLRLLAPTDDERMLGRLGAYEVVGVIGSGGMGVVLKAFDAALNRFVAIKVLAPHLGSSGAARKRFSREAQAAAAVVHDNVMEIYGVADVEGLPYLVMPYVRGPSLQRRLDDDGPLALVEILRIGMQAAAGLAAAHAQGLVHRDVKPANILLADGVERVKLTDFGLARAADDASLTKTGIIAGTPQYMSPEQARGESLDQRSDLFSLGSVLYSICTGRAPFRAETSYGVLRRVTDDEPVAIREINPDIPEWLCRIIARLMSKQPGDRFASARQVAELLEECLAHVQQPTAVPLPASLVPRSNGSGNFSTSRRRSGVFAMIATLGLIGMLLWQAMGDPDADKSQSPAGAAVAEMPPAQSPPSASEAAQPQPAASQPAESQPSATEAAPTRLRHIGALTTGHDVKLACSADGRLIAIVNSNPTLIMLGSGRSRVEGNWKSSADILDAATGKILISIKLTTADEDKVLDATERISHVEGTALAFSPDGKMLAVGTSIGQVKLFHARTGELVRSLDDDVAKLADNETPENWKLLRRAMGSVESLEFSPDGAALAACGSSFADFSEGFDGVQRLGFRTTGPGRLKLWEVETGKLKHDLAGHNDQAFSVAFSPDGKWLASAGRWHTDGDAFGNGVILWSAKSGEQIHRLIRTTANAGVRSIAFSPDSKRLALGTQRFDNSDAEHPSSGGVSLVHASTGIEEWLVTVPGWARPVAFSPDGKSVAVLCGGRSIRFLETETGTTRHEIRPEDSQQGYLWDDFAFAQRGHLLAIGTVDKEQNGGVELWSTRSGNDTDAPAATSPPKEVSGETKDGSKTTTNFTTRASVRTIACSEDGTLIAVANGGPTFIGGVRAKANILDHWKPSAEILDAKTGEMVVSLKLTSDEEDAVLAATEQITHFEVTALALSPDGNLAAVGTDIGQVKLYSARTGELVRSLDDEVSKLADSQTPENWKPLKRAMGSVASLAFSPDGGQLAICGKSFGDYARTFVRERLLDELSTGPGRLKIWDVRTGTLKHDLAGHSHANAVAFSPDGKLLASAGRWNDSQSRTGVVIWNSTTGQKLRTVVTDTNGSANSVAFSPDGKQMAIVSLNFDVDKANDAITSAISLAQVATGVVEWRRAYAGLVKPVAFYSGAVLDLSGGQSFRLMQPETGKTLAIINRPADPNQRGRWNDFAITKRGQIWVTGGEDGEGQGTVEIMDTSGEVR